MGYDIEQRVTRFHIAADQVARAYQLAATLRSPDAMADAAGGMFHGGQTTARWFAFVNPVALEAASDLVSFLTAFRWTPTVADDGSITHLTFTGSRMDPSGLLFETIAPCVSVGCFITMAGEDDAEWQWVFTGDTCRVNIVTPSEWGPSWLLAPADESADESPREPWAADSDAWRVTSSN